MSKFYLGDPTLSAMELWGAEYQENNALLIQPGDRVLLEKICHRERVPISFVGQVEPSGCVVFIDDTTQPETMPVNLDLKHVLADMPRKVFQSDRAPGQLAPLQLPDSLSVRGALERTLRLLSVGSKRFLTNKVDRSVTGLIAQQQCVGPLHTPLSVSSGLPAHRARAGSHVVPVVYSIRMWR